MTAENKTNSLRIVLAALGLIVTVALTLFADRLFLERQEVAASERIVSLRRDVDEVKAQYIRKEAIEPRLQAIEKAIVDFDRRQEKMFDMLQSMAQRRGGGK